MTLTVTTSSVVAATPRSLDEAIRIRADDPERRIVHGGTDVMVGVNAGTVDIERWLSLRRVSELSERSYDDAGCLLLGAGTTFAGLSSAEGQHLTALQMAARTVGSAQIRSAGTIGGNLVTASPAADAVPPLFCYDADVELQSTRGVRTVALTDFFTGPKATVLANDELLTRIRLNSTGGVEWFSKIGTRNAMVISVCSLAARLDPENGVARVAIGSVAPTVRRAVDAEAMLLDPTAADEFAEAVVASAAPIDDVRSTAHYRRRALGVLARRVHGRLWHDLKVAAR